MSYTFRPAVRTETPLIIGIAGPTKSGKTYSAHRLAIGLAPAGSPILMVNAEGPRGHQYADKFKYLACDLTPPYRPTHYTEVLAAAAALKPGVVIIDSASHMHDGPGGILEWHDEIAQKMAKGDEAKLEKMNMAAWVEPKAAENQFIYAMLGMKVPIVLCFRAKEKVKMTGGKVIDLGWQPIAGERVAFETIFTLMLPPHSKGVPNLAISDMREPFDELVPEGKPIDEDLGRKLAEWARGAAKAAAATPDPERAAVLEELNTALVRHGYAGESDAQKGKRQALLTELFGAATRKALESLDVATLRAGIAALAARSTPAPTTPAADAEEHELFKGPANDNKAALVTEIADAIEAWQILSPAQRTKLFVATLGTETPATAPIEKLLELQVFVRRVTEQDRRAQDELNEILLG